MQFAIDAAAPPPALYDQHTPEFRYWATVDALKRGVTFWSSVIPKGTTWFRGKTLDVRVDAGDKLNALYNRASLTFFHSTVEGKVVYTAESPDVVCHEMGHAVLDAIRPQLWDAMSHEVAAFHESFGDMSAMLTALQVTSLREQVFEETAGLYRNSRLSRVAEQLGWAVGRRQPCAVDADALRNAVNCFFYQPAAQLPPVAPSCALSSGAHSYSRVFTGAFFESFAGMVITQGRPTVPDHLKQAGLDWATMLVAAVLAAPVEPSYMAQVAIHMLEADKELFDGRYAPALENGFLRKGILTASSVAAASRLAPRAPVAAARGRAKVSAELPTLSLDGAQFGFGDRPVVVRAAAETTRLTARATALDGSAVPPQSSADAARAYLSEVVMRDHLRRSGRDEDDEAPAARLRTHDLVEDGGDLIVQRRLFEAGPCVRDGRRDAV